MIPVPELGLVISYSFLWGRENAGGQEEGAKARPCAIVLVAETSSENNEEKRVIVVPITHSRPDNLNNAIEIPKNTRHRLGLDDELSWIICTEVNEFIWPGHDLAQVPHSNPPKFDYGYIPPKMFQQITKKINELTSAKVIKLVKRT